MKFVGKVGFWFKDTEVVPDVFRPSIIERSYTGDVERDIRKFETSENLENKNLNINNKISIVSDLYLQKNWGAVKYVLWNGVKWGVKTVDISPFPRIAIELGGVYNGEDA